MEILLIIGTKSGSDNFPIYPILWISICWTSSNPGVATVEGNDSNALVTAHSPGDAVISVVAADGSGASSMCWVSSDTKERVIIREDDIFFYKIVFEDGQTWKCISKDISGIEPPTEYIARAKYNQAQEISCLVGLRR